jgi:hypothetical protein
MKLDRLHMFLSQVQEDFCSEGIEAHLYYYFDCKWHDLVSESHCDEGKSGTLERAKKDPVSYHSSNSLNAWFYFSDTNCVVKLAFPKSPQKATRCQYRERLLKIQKRGEVKG